jgi:hypothetical protein
MLQIKSRVVRRYLVAMLIITSAGLITAKDDPRWVKEEIKQVKLGNFALPVSQQPAPLFSFGQNIVDKGDLIAYVYPVQLKGHKESFIEVVPSLLCGITDKLSLFIELPIAIKFKVEDQISRGLSDLTVQLEGVVYAQETETSVNEITAVGNMTFPTGSALKQPSTGFGSPTFFLGVTLSHSQLDWYYFASLGGQITTYNKQGIKPGNIFFYQGGFGRNIAYKTDGWILNWLVEVNGLYGQRNRICNVTDGNSGGNTLLVGPSLFFATQHFSIDAGIFAVAAQHLFGIQLKENYLAAAFVGWKF